MPPQHRRPFEYPEDAIGTAQELLDNNTREADRLRTCGADAIKKIPSVAKLNAWLKRVHPDCPKLKPRTPMAAAKKWLRDVQKAVIRAFRRLATLVCVRGCVCLRACV